MTELRTRIVLAAVLSYTAIVPVPAVAAPPSGLRGKAVVVSWSETRVQRHVGEPAFYNVTASHDLRVYVSGAGRVFSRPSNSTRAGTGQREQVAAQRARPGFRRSADSP